MPTTHCERQNCLLIPYSGWHGEGKTAGKSFVGGVLVGKFPGFPATFPAVQEEFAHYGQNLWRFGLLNQKFAAKFAEAGNFIVPRLVV
jgi:hypothetical protein